MFKLLSLKNEKRLQFFLRKAANLWNTLPLAIKSSARYSIFINRLNSPDHLSKNSTHHLLGANAHLMSYIVCFAYNPLHTTKNNYRVCVCGDTETELNLYSFTVTFTAHPEQQFIIMFMKLWRKADLLNAMSVWATSICCDFSWCTWCIDPYYSCCFHCY